MIHNYTQQYTQRKGELKMVFSVKGPGQRIFVQRGFEQWIVPSWVSGKGNLAWKLGETLYVKLQDGTTRMLENGKWLPSDAHTEAKAPTPRSPEPESYKLMQFPDTL